VNENAIGRETLSEIAREYDDPTSIEAQIAADAGISPQQVIVDLPSLPDGERAHVHIMMADGVRAFSDISPTPSHLVDVQWRNTTLGVYAPPSDVDAVQAAAEAYFGL
ncbi:MAG: HD domain-containing protein, partial [Halohasta sp.]